MTRALYGIPTRLASGLAAMLPVLQTGGQPSTAAPERFSCPKIWDARELADWANPIAGAGGPPHFYSEEEYYAAPVDNLRTYPVYHPDREPAGYWEWLHRQKPEPLIEIGRARTKAEWIEVGRRVFDELDIPFSRSSDAAGIAWLRDREAIEKDRPMITREGQFPAFRWVVEKPGQVRLSMVNCSICHLRVLEDGTLLRGAPTNLFPGGGAALAAVLKGDPEEEPDPTPPRSAGERFYESYGVPWLADDVHARYRSSVKAEEIQAIEDSAITGTTFARFNGSPFFVTKFQDLIGVKDHRYLDATGTHKNRGPADIARYGILVQYADDGAIGEHRFMSEAQRRLTVRPSDDAMFAIGMFLYSLEVPPSPHPLDEWARRGQVVFTENGCGACHTPPLYTNNKLVPASGFQPPMDDPATRRLDIMKRRVGTDPGLALRTRKGTGYYKVPTLRGLWYRDVLEHSGSVRTLEEWFDPRRVRDDYEPSGWKGPGITKRAVPGHDFPFELSDDEKRALIAFLKTL